MSSPNRPLDGARADEIRLDQQLEAEFQAHVAHRVDDLTAQGLPAQEALQRALREFGDPERLKQESREARAAERRPMNRSVGAAHRLDALRQDAAYSLRQLRRNPGFALTALLTLVLGVGATSTIVSVVDAVVFEPLPFERPERVVFAEMLTPERQWFSVAEPAFLDWQAQARSFERLAATASRGATLGGLGEPRSIVLGSATHALLSVLGVEPELGRWFTPEEDVPGSEGTVAVLSHATWVRDFGADPGVLGTKVDVDGTSFEVVGVLPESIEFVLEDVPLFVPMGPDPDMDRGEHFLSVIGRLAEGVTLTQAHAELGEIQEILGQLHRVDEGWSARVRDSREVLIGDSTVRAAWILLAAAGLLLIMACVNVSNLLMVRATMREAEMGLRAALGASRGRLVRQLFTESALLAAFGGVLGVVLSYMALPTIRALGDARIPRLDSASLDGTALGACLLAVLGASVACGLAPIVQLRSGSLRASAGTGRRGGHDPGRRTRSLLVGTQVAVTVVLLAGTGLLFRSFMALSSVDPGFEAEGTLAVRLNMPDATYGWQGRADLMPVLREAVASVPGVTHVGATAVDPFSGGSLANFVARNDRMPDRAADFTPIHWRPVTSGFFEAMGMELKAGRTFVDTDERPALPSTVIGEGLARELWGNEDPIDQVLVWGDPQGSRLRVIGVVEDLRDVELAEEPYPIVYRPYQQIPWAVMTLVVRSQGEASAIAAGVRARIREVAPDLPIPEMRSLEANLSEAVAEPRFNLQLLGGFAIVGLLMAVIGVYGLTSFEVRRRLREIGIRLSLGAEPVELRWMILRERVVLTALSASVGLVVAWLLSRWIESQLFGITKNDLVTWVSVLGIVMSASALATWIPGRRATLVDPRDVLNEE